MSNPREMGGLRGDNSIFGKNNQCSKSCHIILLFENRFAAQQYEITINKIKR